MLLAALGLLVALLLGKAGFDEMYVLGVRGGLVQPFWAGIAGMVAAALIALAVLALWRRWPGAARLAVVAGVLSIVFHVYGALPPHRNVGVLGAIIGVVTGAALVAAALRGGRRREGGDAAGVAARPA